MELSHFPIDKMRELVQAFAAEEQLLLKRNSITPLARAASCSAREARKLVQHFKIWLAGNGIDFTSPAGVDEVRLYLAGKRIDTFCDAQNQRYSWGVGPKEERFLRAAASTSKYSRCRMALHLGYDRDEGSLAELEVKMERVGFIDLGGGLKNIITAAGREWLAKRNGEAPRGEAG